MSLLSESLSFDYGGSLIGGDSRPERSEHHRKGHPSRGIARRRRPRERGADRRPDGQYE